MLYFFKILMAPYLISRKNMRQKTRKPLDEMQIDQVKLDPNSRDDIPQLLKGLQYIFLNPILGYQLKPGHPIKPKGYERRVFYPAGEAGVHPSGQPTTKTNQGNLYQTNASPPWFHPDASPHNYE